ncbi:MAG: radical SAM protein [Firmicutes bacterium]|nr:radical SAM protein [Bacillota bacterium]
MKKVNNIFGKGNLYEEKDLGEKIYATSAACMSVWSDMLSFANSRKSKFVSNPQEADTIVVLGCQVTDLAVLNDLEVARKLHELTGKDIYMGGCLAQRMDIKLPNFIKRLDVVRKVNQDLEDRTLVHFEKPFWVPDFEESNDNLKEGNLFRNYYPLKIGAGCHGKCKYCTIRHTRGEGYEMIPEEQIDEFLNHDNVVLISDSPTISQVKSWCQIAKKFNKEISIRNIEPQNLIKCREELLDLAQEGLLDIVHCPVQSFDEELLKIMNRSVKATNEAVELINELKIRGVTTATNIIIDYTVGDKVYSNHDKEKLEKSFDYYSWNPYFDGNFDMERAKHRFKKYITNKNIK